MLLKDGFDAPKEPSRTSYAFARHLQLKMDSIGFHIFHSHVFDIIDVGFPKPTNAL